MKIDDRLYWFEEQMKKPRDPRGQHSLMGEHATGSMLSEDVCAVAGGNQATCVAARRPFDPKNLPELKKGHTVHP